MADDVTRDRSTSSNTTLRVAPLSSLDDFQVADGYPDPRGWDVIASDGLEAGKVHDLVVDTGSMRTRYLDVKLDPDIADDAHVLLPIGAARMHDADDHVLLDNLSLAQIAALPTYEHGSITREYESALLGSLPAPATGTATATAPVDNTATDADFYSSRHFDDSGFVARTDQPAARAPAPDAPDAPDADTTRFVRSEEELRVGKRQVAAGEVDVHKRIETEHVQRPVTLTHEEVTVERRPVSAERLASGSTEVERSGDEIRIPVIEEEVVVETRQVVKEEIIIRKHAVSEEKTVEADLRRERIDVDRSDADRADA